MKSSQIHRIASTAGSVETSQHVDKRRWLDAVLAYCPHKLFLYVLVALVSGSIGVHYLSWEMISNDGNTDIPFLGHDRTNFLLGLNYYVQDDWRLPLFDVDDLNQFGVDAPAANVIFTDSIPILAVFMKVSYMVHPKLVDPYGYWLLLCYILQGVSFSFLLFQLGERRLIFHLMSAGLVAALPALAFRYGHVALCSHFLLILSIGIYIRSRKPKLLPGSLILSFLIVVLSLLVHVYLWLMVSGIFGATILQALLDRRIKVRKFFLILGAVILAQVMVMFLTGHVRLGSGAPVGGGGFGNYSMNLLSPFWPQLSSIGGNETFILNATGGQYEGFNYLGAGILALLAVALISSLPLWLSIVRRNLVLASILVLFTVFAVSNRVYFGEIALIKVPLPRLIEDIANTFRSSGRFFWPVSYALLSTILVILSRRFNVRFVVSMLAFALAVQLFDGWPLRNHTDPLGQENAKERAGELLRLRELVAAHDALLLFPPRSYLKLLSPQTQDTGLTLMHAASIEDVTTNSAYQARPIIRFQEADGNLIDQIKMVLNAENLVAVDQDLLPVTAVEALTEEPAYSYKGFSILLGKKSVNVDGVFAPTSRPVMPLGYELTGLEMSDWMLLPVADNGVWTEDERTDLFLSLPRRPEEDVVLQIKLTPNLSEIRPSSSLRFLSGESVIATVDIHYSQREYTLSVVIDPLHFSRKGVAHLIIEQEELFSPREIGINNDIRKLGMFIHSIEVRTPMDVGSAVPPVRLTFRDEAPLHTSVAATGLSGTEALGTWSEGEVTTFRIPIQSVREPLPIVMRLQATAFINPKRPSFGLTMLVNGEMLFSRTITNSEVLIEQEIPSHLIGQREHIELEFRYDSPASPRELGISGDSRSLALLFRSMELFSSGVTSRSALPQN